jgi:hypothetical protein
MLFKRLQIIQTASNALKNKLLILALEIGIV